MLFYIDINDACHLRCPTCVRGVRLLPNTARKMPLDKFRTVIAKAKREGAYRVDVFNWTEPFLVSNLEEYVRIIRDFDLPCGISSTLSLKRIDNLESVLAQTEILTVSMSGFNQKIYEVNHVGGNVEAVLENLERIAALKKSGRIDTCVNVRFLLFDYNSGDVESLRGVAERLGLGFEVLVASGHPKNTPMTFVLPDVQQRLATYSATNSREPRGHICPLKFEHVAVDCEGDVYLCCAVGNFDVLKIGPYLDLSPEEILLRRFQHPICNTCNWERRPATPEEKQLLTRAMMHQLDIL
jgi:MoaA/NifB/PqqE/SkfB family radical SAM enzyme